MILKNQLDATDNDFESTYRDYYLKIDIRHTSIAIAIWLIPLLPLGYIDYLIFGKSNQLTILLVSRLVFFLLSLYTIFAFLKVTSFKQYDSIFYRWAIITIAFVLFLNYNWAPYVPPNGDITILILFTAYMISPSRLFLRAVPPITLSIGNVALQWCIADSASNTFAPTVLVAIIMANVLGAILSTSLQEHRRSEFKARLEEACAKEKLKRLATIDPLTGIVNRRELIHKTIKEFEQAKNNGQVFSVLMMDIDNFKQLNDNYGHDVGDKILQHFASYVENKLNENKIWGRLGGDEFVLILCNTRSDQAKIIAEDLMTDLNKEPVISQDKRINYTISIGITEVNDLDSSYKTTQKRADEALYKVKRNGRGFIAVL
ncbi:MAG: GGDEF domain-containing protein [Veillonellales bacterium]